jgi:hypothetical protein
MIRYNLSIDQIVWRATGKKRGIFAELAVVLYVQRHREEGPANDSVGGLLVLAP